MKNQEVLVFSIALEGYLKLFSSCIESQRKYCLNFGFNYVLIDKAPRQMSPFEAAWLKIFLLRAALDSHYKWIAFIDADCEIRDHAPSFVEDLEQFESDKSIFMAHGFSGRINSGVIFLRNSEEVKDYLERVISNGDKEVPNEDKALYENGHMIHYGKNNPHVQIIDFEKWNNNRTLEEQSYIQHYSGGRLRELYLEESSSKEIKKEPISRLKRIDYFFRTKNPKPTVKDIQKLIPFYQEFYPELYR